MLMTYDLLLQKAEAYVTKFIRKHDNQKLVFHNLTLTRNIVAVAGQVATYYNLDEKDNFIVSAAAWFLYSGYYKDYLMHLQASAKIAEEFFKEQGLEIETTDSIKQCILATAHDADPVALPEQILCDADTFYFGTEDFFGYNKLKRREHELVNKTSVDKNEWSRQAITLLQSHKYYTEYCEGRLGNNKQASLDRLKKKNPLLLLDDTSIASIFENAPGVKETTPGEKEKAKENKLASADRTIETMFRTTSTNSQRLSSQADTKAHIMISVNTIIISLMLGLRQIGQSSKFSVPVILLIVVNLVTIIFSILATRPNVARRNFSDADFEQNKVNLLFFGNFFSMNFDDYAKAMMHIMDEKQTLYITMLRNLYEQGAVLARKYKLLKMSYNVFMYGLILSVISFFIASL